MQFMIYLFIGASAAVVNLIIFMGIYRSGMPVEFAAPIAFAIAAAVNYFLSISILFRSKVKWNSGVEIMVYSLVVIAVGAFDLYFTKFLLGGGFSPQLAKLLD